MTLDIFSLYNLNENMDVDRRKQGHTSTLPTAGAFPSTKVCSQKYEDLSAGEKSIVMCVGHFTVYSTQAAFGLFPGDFLGS